MFAGLKQKVLQDKASSDPTKTQIDSDKDEQDKRPDNASSNEAQKGSPKILEVITNSKNSVQCAMSVLFSFCLPYSNLH